MHSLPIEVQQELLDFIPQESIQPEPSMSDLRFQYWVIRELLIDVQSPDFSSTKRAVNKHIKRREERADALSHTLAEQNGIPHAASLLIYFAKQDLERGNFKPY